MELKKKIEKVLSEILSDKYECRVALHFEKTTEQPKRKERDHSNAMQR